MTIKLPNTYPPDLPAGIAHGIKRGSGLGQFNLGVMLGPLVDPEIKQIINSRKNTLEIGKENEKLGFAILDCDHNLPAISFSCLNDDDKLTEMEVMSTALHTFKWLGVEKILLIDSVETFENLDEPLLRVDDHINMTGVNPLEFWMMTDEPDPFFLDVKSLYKGKDQGALAGLKGIVHFAVLQSAPKELIHKSKGFADSHGRAIVPESVLASYLGFDVYAVALSNNSKTDKSGVTDRILELIRGM